MIARRCGISDPAIHYHFGSKSEIYETLLVEPRYDCAAPEGGGRDAIASFMEQRFWWWARDAEFVRMLLREQLRGRPESISYMMNSERQYRAELEQAARGVYGEAAGTVADLSWHLLAGALWDVILAYGSDAEEIIQQDYFRTRIRRLIDTALDAGERCRQ